MNNSTSRFSDRVKNYVTYRPRYPRQITGILKDNIGLTAEWIIADLGSGTGISSEPFLSNGNIVYGIEPNLNMRRAAEEQFSENSRFISIDGTAEHTTLENSSIDCVVSGQAFHWFDRKKTAQETGRITKKGGYNVLFWNNRKDRGSSFLRDYEKLLHTYCPDYGKVTQKNITTDDLADLFGSHNYGSAVLDNHQDFDFSGLLGRLHSSSYSPPPDDPLYPEMKAGLKDLFYNYQQNGRVRFEYDTEIYWAQIL